MKTTRNALLAGAVLALGAVGAAPALAQDTPDVGGGINIGGTVASTQELILPSVSGLSTFKKAGTQKLSFTAQVITTDDTAQLSIGDGSTTSTKTEGYMTSGSKKLALPLQARFGKSAAQPLDNPIDPELTHWKGPISRQPAVVGLSQKVTKKATGTYHKVLFVTLSPATP
jgi:hypothetical protein